MHRKFNSLKHLEVLSHKCGLLDLASISHKSLKCVSILMIQVFTSGRQVHWFLRKGSQRESDSNMRHRQVSFRYLWLEPVWVRLGGSWGTSIPAWEGLVSESWSDSCCSFHRQVCNRRYNYIPNTLQHAIWNHMSKYGNVRASWKSSILWHLGYYADRCALSIK